MQIVGYPFFTITSGSAQVDFTSCELPQFNVITTSITTQSNDFEFDVSGVLQFQFEIINDTDLFKVCKILSYSTGMELFTIVLMPHSTYSSSTYTMPLKFRCEKDLKINIFAWEGK